MSISVNPEDLVRAATELSNVVEELDNSAMGDLSGTVGHALLSQRVTEFQKAWSVERLEILGLLRALSESIRSASDAFVAADRTGAQPFIDALKPQDATGTPYAMEAK